MGQNFMPYLQSIIALVGVILLIVGVAWLFKRFSGVGGFAFKENAELQVKAVKLLDPHTKLAVFSWRGTTYLISHNSHAITLLDKSPGESN